MLASNISLKPSKTSWWARAMRLRSLRWLNVLTISAPNKKPAPRGDRPQPSISSGSDHSRSHMAPSCGTSCLRSSSRILSTVSMSGLRPPCTQSTAPAGLPTEPPLEPDAPDPGGPVRAGADTPLGRLGPGACALLPPAAPAALADDEPVLPCRRRGKRLMMSPSLLHTSISTSPSMYSCCGIESVAGLSVLEAPSTIAPKARLSNTSQQYRHTLALPYFRRHSS